MGPISASPSSPAGSRAGPWTGAGGSGRYPGVEIWIGNREQVGVAETPGISDDPFGRTPALQSRSPASDCPDPEILGYVLTLVVEASPVLSAEREQFEEQARQSSRESYLTLGYATNTIFESGEAGGSAAIRVRIPLFDRKHERTVAQAGSAWRSSEDTPLAGFLTEIGKLCGQAARIRELDTLRQFYRDRLKYRQERVDEGLEEAPVL